MAGPWEDYATPTGSSGPWQDFAPSPVTPDARRVKDIGDAIVAGLQNSATGFALRGKMPSQQLDENAPWYHRIAAGGAGMAADLPLSVVGAVGGGAAGTAVVPGVGTVVGGGAGAFAAPMALRAALIEAYTNNHAMSWKGAWEIALAGLTGGAKGAVIGGATLGAGRAVAPLLAGSGKVVAGAGIFGTELATLTATSAAVEGHMPTWQDFMDNAILLGGMKGAIKIAGGLRSIYVQTGKLPAEVVGDAARDPQLKAELTAVRMEHKDDSSLYALVTENTIPGEKPYRVTFMTDKGIAYHIAAKDAVEAVDIAKDAGFIKPSEIVAELPNAYRPLALEQRIAASLEADPRPEAFRAIIGAKEPPKLGQPPIQDPVKYEYITDRDTLQGVLRLTEQTYAREIETQTRGVVPNKQTAAEALRLVANGDVVEHVVGTAENAAQIYARTHILKGVTENAYNKIVALKDIDPADMTPRMKLEALASIEQLSMMVAEFRGARAEAGRALQIFQALKRDASVMPDAETIVKLYERKGSLQDIAALMAGLKDPAQMQRFAKDYVEATTMEKVLEAWKAGILSGPQTHLANILGNLTKWIVELPESVTAATLTAGRQLAKGDPLTMAQYKARAFAPLYGIQLGAVDSIKIAAEVWKQKGAHLEKADVYRTAIEGKKGEIIRLPFRALQVEDALFRTVAERAKAHEMAVDRVVKEGLLHPETAEGRSQVVAYTENPALGLSEKVGLEAINTVQQAGAEGVFAQRLGPRLETVQRAMAGHPIGFIIPFFRTPANLVSWAVQHTPGLNLMSARWREAFAAGGEQRDRAIARVVIGAGLAITAFNMAQDGTLTGGGLFDKELGGTKRAAGWQPYSIKIGDKFYNYQRIEPVAKVLGLSADLLEIMQNTKDDEDKAKIASMLVLMFGNATVSTTYLSGLSNAIQSITDPARYGENFLEQYATSLVPKIVGQITAMADPHKREVDGVLDAIQSQIPFLREKLMPKRDVWGQPSSNDRWFAVMPVARTTISDDKVKTEAVRLQVAIADAPKFVLERGPFKPGEKRIELSSEQRDIFKEVSGKSAMTILAPIVNAPDWERIPDFAKAEVYKRVLEGTRKQGQYAALPPDAAARQQLREKIVDKIIKQTQEAVGTGAAPVATVTERPVVKEPESKPKKRVKYGDKGERK